MSLAEKIFMGVSGAAGWIIVGFIIWWIRTQ